MEDLIIKAKEHLLSYGYKGFANHTVMPALMAEFATIQAKEDREYCQHTVESAHLCSVSPNCYYCKYKPKLK